MDGRCEKKTTEGVDLCDIYTHSDIKRKTEKPKENVFINDKVIW